MIVARGLVKRFDGHTAVAGVDLVLRRGEIVALMGESGAGKTTLMRILHLLLPSDGGELLFNGRPVGAENVEARRRMAMVAQRPHMFRGTLLDNATLPLRLRGVPAAEARRRVEPLLTRFGLEKCLDRSAVKLSGGETQRLAFVRALSSEPEVLFLDEFSTNLDPDNVALLEDDVKRFAAAGGAVLLVSHNLTQVGRLADRAVLLDTGRIADQGAAAEVIDRLVSRWRSLERSPRDRTPAKEAL